MSSKMDVTEQVSQEVPVPVAVTAAAPSIQASLTTTEKMNTSVDEGDEKTEFKIKEDDDVEPTSDPYFYHSRTLIEAGDVVIIYQTRDSITAITVTPGQLFHTKYGKYQHTDFIGRPFGSRVFSPPPFPGFLHVLRPTPELWTLSLPHRTQILYMPDIAFISAQLRVMPGRTIIEAGTGSGSMSHSLAQQLGKTGKLWSFEYHATRYEKAMVEFEEHGLGGGKKRRKVAKEENKGEDVVVEGENPVKQEAEGQDEWESTVRLQHRNVCKEGFGDEAKEADAVFLDLPAPWEAIPHAVKALKSDISTRICCFSPCMEQVTRTVTALDAHGFSDITMYEVLIRPHEIVNPPTLETVSSISARLRTQEIRKEERRRFQMSNARARTKNQKEKEEEGEEEMAVAGDAAEGVKRSSEDSVGQEGSRVDVGKKRQRIQGDETSTVQETATTTNPAEQGDKSTEASTKDWTIMEPFVNLKPVTDVRGHTSYLTFATLYPKSVTDEMDSLASTERAKMVEQTAALAGIEVDKETVERLVKGMKTGPEIMEEVVEIEV